MAELENPSCLSRDGKLLPILWFEFLLNPSILEEHLAKDNPEPGGTDLILQFLANASYPKEREQMTFPPVTILPIEKSESTENGEETKETPADSKKVTALKLLALKVASFLKWDFNILQPKLPLPMQKTLIFNLLCVSVEGEQPTEISNHLECDLSSASDQTFFAINLYHRWCARTVLFDLFTAKPLKGTPIVVPGYQDPTVVPPAVVDALMKSICDRLPDTQIILERCLQLKRDIKIPTMHTFDMLSEVKNNIEFFWDAGAPVSWQEIVCQTSYDLGSVQYYLREYSKAATLFFHASKLYDEMPNPVFCRIDRDILTGYCVALGGMLQKPVMSVQPGAVERLQCSVENNYEGIVEILMEDNIKCEIPLSYREQIAANLLMVEHTNIKVPIGELHFQVCTLNVLRTITSGMAVTMDYTAALLALGEGGANFLCDAVSKLIPHLKKKQTLLLKSYIRYIVKSLAIANPMFGKILTRPRVLGPLLAPEATDDSRALTQMQQNLTLVNREFPGHPALQLGELELRLQTTFDPRVVWELIPALHSLGLRRPAWHITKRWELSNPMHSLILELPPGYVQEATYVLLAKVKELIKLKSFIEARVILEMVEREVMELSFNLSRLVRFEVMYLDLLHLQNMPMTRPPSEGWILELSMQTKACLTSCLAKTVDLLPRPEIGEECALFLLNNRQWDYLAALVVDRGSFLELPVILSRACIEIGASNGTRKAVRELWDIVLPMYAISSGQQKRGVSGIPSLVQREAPYIIMPRTIFNRYFEKIKDATILSVLISLLSKMHNILKDDVNNNITIDSNANWPSVIGNSGVFGLRLVQESLVTLLRHALKLYPACLPWIKVKADLSFVTGQNAEALKFYLEGAALSSDFFSQPLLRFSMDESVVRHVVRCCSQLHCHTQAAVFCQFLDEVDYATAFKCLQEKANHDAMDTYYPCIWDYTILEFLVHIHTKRGEVSKKELCLKLIGQLELNGNNNVEIQREAANVRRNRFLRAMVRQYL